MTFKLPNPVGDYYTEGMGMFVSLPNGSKLYSGAQLLQVRRDALEQAALICYRNAQSTSGDEIRKLKDETK